MSSSLDRKKIEEIIERLQDDIEQAEEFLIMPHLKEFVIVGHLDSDAVFQIVGGDINNRFAYNFTGYGLRATKFYSLEYANQIIENNNLRERYPTVFAMDRVKYVTGWINRAKATLENFDAILNNFK